MSTESQPARGAYMAAHPVPAKLIGVGLRVMVPNWRAGEVIGWVEGVVTQVRDHGEEPTYIVTINENLDEIMYFGWSIGATFADTSFEALSELVTTAERANDLLRRLNAHDEGTLAHGFSPSEGEAGGAYWHVQTALIAILTQYFDNEALALGVREESVSNGESIEYTLRALGLAHFI